MNAHRSIHFNALPEATRQRLVGSFSGKEYPVPLVSLPTARKRGWITLWVVGAVMLAFAGGADYDRQLLEHSAWFGVGLGMVLTAAGILGLKHAGKLRKALPFPPGRYMYAMEFVDARGAVLTLYSLSQVQDFRATHQHTNG